MKQDTIIECLTRGVENIYPSREELEKRLQSSRKLKIYLGIDPTAPTLHLGHMVQLMKLRQFQKLGHEVIILIGDFTAQIGDPTDKMATRKTLTHKEVLRNAKDYKKQIGRFLDMKKTKFFFNARWHGKLSALDMLTLASHFSVQRLLERDMFQKRLAEGKIIHLHEFFYPVLQAYDSVAMNVDVEVGGNDQTFNMLAGRTLMKKMKHKEKFVVATKLLTDAQGVKMGKTEGNMATLNDSPQNMYGKILSWPDGFIIPGFELLTEMEMEEIKNMQAKIQSGNPKTYKMKLAKSVVALNFGQNAAEKAEEAFSLIHEQKQTPEDVAVKKVMSRHILDVLVETKLAASKSEARRVIEQGGVSIDGKIVTDITTAISEPCVIQRGKLRFVKIVF